MNISAPFIRRPVMTMLLSLAALIFGILSYQKLPVSALPDVEYPVIQVNANFPGASPMVMAQNVASPLEKEFLQIRGIKQVTSQNRQGNSIITLQFRLDRDVDSAAPDVQQAINAAQGRLPSDMPDPPVYEKTNPNEQPILYIGFASNTMTDGDLYDYAFKEVAQKINVVEGVSGVQVFGSPRAVRIKVDAQKLYDRGITYEDVNEAVRRGSTLSSAGELKGDTISLTIKPDSQLTEAEDYGNLIVAYRDGNPLRLREVADVVDSLENEERQLNYYAEGVPSDGSAVVLAVRKANDANAVAVAERIDRLLPELESIIPPSIRMKVIYSRAESVISAIQDVKTTLAIAFGLVILVIFLFLGRLRDTMIPLVIMPLSLVLTFIVMRPLGFNIDNLSLMALTLAIGFLVDDAIVFLENTVRRMQDFHEKPYDAALNSAKEISFTIVATSVTLVAVFVPVVFMPGLIGRIFTEFGMTIVIVILMSTLLALTLTPMMCARYLKPHEHGEENLIEKNAHRIEHGLLALYRPTLRFILRRNWISVFLWLVAAIGVFQFGKVLPKTFLPTGDSSFIAGIHLTDTGNSPSRVHELQNQMDKRINSNPNVEQFVSVSGVGQFLQGNFMISFIALKEPGERIPMQKNSDQEPSIQEINAQLKRAISQIPGVIPAIRPRPTLEISTGTTGQQQGEYAFSLYGLNKDQVYKAAQQITGKLRQKEQKGELFSSVQNDLYLDNPELKIEINRDAASTYGVDTVSLASMLSQAYSENFTYLIKESNLQYEVIVEAQDQWSEKSEDMSGLFLEHAGSENFHVGSQNSGVLLPSTLIPFESVARFREKTGPLSINHIDNFPSVTVFFDVLPGAAVGDAVNFILKSKNQVVPSGVKTELQGKADTFKETLTSGVVLAALAVFVMYIALGLLYESYAHPFTVMAALPVAVVGGLGTLWLFQQELSLYAGIGLFMLLGIVQKNGIILIDFALMRQEEGKSPREAIYEASLERFRPIVMTTLSTVFGVLPIALGFGADGEARAPLGMAIVGGLLVAQIITLYVTPSFYLIFDGLQTRVLDRFSLFQRGVRMK